MELIPIGGAALALGTLHRVAGLEGSSRLDNFRRQVGLKGRQHRVQVIGHGKVATILEQRKDVLRMGGVLRRHLIELSPEAENAQRIAACDVYPTIEVDRIRRPRWVFKNF